MQEAFHARFRAILCTPEFLLQGAPFNAVSKSHEILMLVAKKAVSGVVAKKSSIYMVLIV